MDGKTLYERFNEQIELARSETDPRIRELRFLAAEKYLLADAVPDWQAKIREVNMGDTYNIGQAGTVGPNSNITGDVNQTYTPPADDGKLLEEIIKLLNANFQSIKTQRVQEAELAARENNIPKALAVLASADDYELEKEAQLIGTPTAATETRKYKVATALQFARIHPWTQLSHRDYLEETDRIDANVYDRIWEKLERFGICLIRLSAQQAETAVLENVVKLIGFPAEEQNDYTGMAKDITPDPKGRKSSGDTTSELGFHVDGTQDPHQPAFLAFQYVSGAKFGANSRFADAAGILYTFDEATRFDLITTLARPDAATFSKLGMSYTGPVFSFSATNALMCRIRFDSIIHVHDDCKTAFDVLKQRFEDLQNSSMFLPHEGDIVVFDNWRVMHARDEIGGQIQRHHRRVWIAMPRVEHQTRYLMGIRPIPATVAGKIKEMSESTNR